MKSLPLAICLVTGCLAILPETGEDLKRLVKYPRCWCQRRNQDRVQYVCPSSKREVASCGLSKAKYVEGVCCKDVEGDNKLKASKGRIRNKRDAGGKNIKTERAKEEEPDDINKNEPQEKKKKERKKKSMMGVKRKILYGRGRMIG